MRSGWCKTRFHSDGKRRFGQLVRGLCPECRTNIKQTPECQAIERQITILQTRKEDIEIKISSLRYRLNLLFQKASEADSSQENQGSKKRKKGANQNALTSKKQLN